VFLTAFFPRQGRGWVTPKRAATTTAAYYLRRWAQYRHRSGGRLHPEPDDAVSERDEVTGRATHRRWFRFVTPQTWGFRLQKDGQWAWQDPALPRF
jgi:hypothetical protein